MASTFEVACPPIEAVVLHGEGDQALQKFRNASTLDTALRFRSLGVAPDLAQADRSLVDQLRLVGDWFFERPVDELRGLCEEPAFRVWLSDAARTFKGESGASSSDLLLRRLPYIFLRNLEEIDPRRAWSAGVPCTGRIAPLGSQCRLVPNGGELPVVITTAKDSVSLIAADGSDAVATFSFSPSKVSARGSGIRAVKRRFAILGLEIFSPLDFPELVRRDSVSGAALEEADADAIAPLAAAMDFLLQAWPESIPDVMSVFRGFVALDAPNGHTYSASSDAAPLIIQLTLQPAGGAAVLAETIIHETAHLKLHALTEISALLIDDGVPRHHHPWRPDLRPLSGVLFGVHAFLNVSKMYEHAVSRGVACSFALQEHERRCSEVREALTTLAREAVFTQTGQAVFEQMCRKAAFHP